LDIIASPKLSYHGLTLTQDYELYMQQSKH
jgi:hypothetical protein